MDVDGDGDFDAFSGAENGGIHYYQNTGGVFTAQTGADNPFNGVDVGDYSTPTFVDVDADGDFDAFIGEKDSVINYYRNYGIHHETQAVAGATDVSFGANRVMLNANNAGAGVDLGNTEVYIETEVQATTVDDEALNHRYYITPTTTSGLNASITFFFSAADIPTRQDCNTLDVYHWDGSAWGSAITPDSRQCATEPYSLTVSSISAFSPFVLRSGGTAPTAVGALHVAAQVPGLLLTAAGSVLAGVAAWVNRRKK